jgi:hypothetical protein
VLPCQRPRQPQGHWAHAVAGVDGHGCRKFGEHVRTHRRKAKKAHRRLVNGRADGDGAPGRQLLERRRHLQGRSRRGIRELQIRTERIEDPRPRMHPEPQR